MKKPTKALIGKMIKWYVETRGDRFYQIIKGDGAAVNKVKDIVFNINDNMVQITSLAYGRSVYFVFSELLAEYENKK